MVDASIDEVESAIFTALETLKPSKVKLVERFASTTANITTDQILAMVGNNNPAILLAQERGAPRDTVQTLSSGATETVETVDWLIFLVVADARQPKQALKGNAAIKGVYTLQAEVYRALNQLSIDGLWRSSTLQSKGHQWAATELGKVYVSMLRFSSEVVVPNADAPDLSTPMDDAHGGGIYLDINVIDETVPMHADTIDQAFADTT